MSRELQRVSDELMSQRGQGLETKAKVDRLLSELSEAREQAEQLQEECRTRV